MLERTAGSRFGVPSNYSGSTVREPPISFGQSVIFGLSVVDTQNRLCVVDVQRRLEAEGG
jgi:hypothetical protein